MNQYLPHRTTNIFILSLCLLIASSTSLIAADSNFAIETFNEVSSPEEISFLSQFINMMTTLGLMIALILFIAWFLKRLTQSRMEEVNQKSLIKIVEKRMVSPKTTIYLLEVDGKEILIAESVNGASKLMELPPKTKF